MTATETPRSAGREQTRARYPDETGYIERDGVRVFWERYGEGEPAVLFLPTWSIVHSRVLEGTDPVFRASRTRADVRRPRERPLGSARRARGVCAIGVRRRCPCRDGRERHGPSVGRVAVDGRAPGDAARRKSRRARRGSGVHRAGRAAASVVAAGPRSGDVHRAPGRHTRAGRSSTATTGSSTTRTSSSSSSARSSASRIRPSRSRTASGGASIRTPRRLR